MEIVSENFPVPCDRMTRGIKRLLEQREQLSKQKKAEGEVMVEVRRGTNGKKIVRVFRSSNKDNIDKQSNADRTMETFHEGIIEKRIAQEFSVSALLFNVFLQIKSKFCLTTRNGARASSGTGEKNLGIAL